MHGRGTEYLCYGFINDKASMLIRHQWEGGIGAYHRQWGMKIGSKPTLAAAHSKAQEAQERCEL